MLAIKLLPAHDGDAIIVRIDDAPHRSAILIDGGYTSTFQKCIRSELEGAARQGYELDLVVASHIDADHVAGLVAFFRDNGKAIQPQIISVKEVWHNSLRSLTSSHKPATAANPVDDEILDEIRRQGFPIAEDAEPADISARQGSSLAGTLLSNSYRWNGGDGTTRITGNGHPSKRLAPNAYVTVIGPNEERLDALRDWWISEIRQLGFVGTITPELKFDDAFEFMTAREDLRSDTSSYEMSSRSSSTKTLEDVYEPDDSIINGSSITIIVEHRQLRVLFLADAWAEDTLKSLRAISCADPPLLFDAIKVAHHGSMRNTSPELLAFIDSPRYLVSTNGSKHGHPDIEVLKAIVDRPARFQRTLYFNYSTPASQFMKSYANVSVTPFEVVEGFADWIVLSNSVR